MVERRTKRKMEKIPIKEENLKVVLQIILEILTEDQIKKLEERLANIE